MKKIATLLSILVIAMAATTTINAKAPKTESTVVLTVNPKMSCQNCENKIKTNLRYEKGIKNIATNLNDQTVTVSYDPAKTDATKIIAGLKKIGYTATEANGKCAKAEGCCKKAEAACSKAEGCCKKAEAACSKTEGCCKKAEAACSKTEGCCKKAEAACSKTEGCCKK